LRNPKINALADKKQKALKILKILGKVFLGIFIFLLILILFIRSPWGQNIIKDKVINSIEEKTGGQIALEKLFIQFNGDIQIDELLIKTPAGDTLIFAGSLSAHIPLLPLIKGNSFGLDSFNAENVKARIVRKDSVTGYNYEFLTRAYASDTTQAATTADTTSAPMEISIGDIKLKDFDIIYNDEVSGIDSKIQFETLELELTETDLQKMVFSADEAIIKNANFNYEQTKPFPESDSEPPPMPVFEINNLEFTNISGVYDSKPDSLYTDFKIADLNLDNSKIDLKDNIIRSEFIGISNSDVTLKMKQSSGKPTEATEASSPFNWPEWNVDLPDNPL